MDHSKQSAFGYCPETKLSPLPRMPSLTSATVISSMSESPTMSRVMSTSSAAGHTVTVTHTDIFNSGFWTSVSQDVVRVNQLRENLKSTVLASKASGTSENYLRAFNRWKAFARDVLGTSDFPVRPIDCALYLQHLLESFKSVSAINCAFYAFRWAHLLAGLDSPTLHPTVIAVKEGAIRLASQPLSKRKEPLDASHLKFLAADSNLDDLLQLRNLVMFILAFSGFLRSSELCAIRSKDVQFNEGFITINIEKSKTDQLREGRSVVIAESCSDTCPCTLLKLYIQKAQIADNSDEYLFRPISSSDIRNDCASHPCRNNGTCTDRVNGFNCSCAAGFNGTQCDTDIDDCASHPCKNNGTCADRVNGFNCSCAPGFNGTQCDTDIDECAAQVNPCDAVTNSECKNTDGSYNCQCKGGFVRNGPNCEADICKNYQNLTDAERKYDYVTVNPKCDDTLNGWYRFQGAAGTKVVTTCPPKNRCDADFPAWLSGDHPTVADGTVTRKVCIHQFGDCCEQSVFIQVKNCGSYYIYKLNSPGTCNTRYCSTD